MASGNRPCALPAEEPEKTNATLAAAYQALTAQGTIREDVAQRAVLEKLEALRTQLLTYAPGNQPGWLTLLRKPARPAPRGLYIWGNVGRGKSMLMNLFFDNVPMEKKRRVHFHRFMQDVHAQLHRIRQESRAGDPLTPLIAEMAAQTSLLCLDEMQATDVADASLLHRLFEGLMSRGVVIVTTSNHPPASVYTGGVQRERFDKFIRLLEEKMDLASLSSPEDYRHMQLKAMQRVYFFPLGPAANRFIEQTIAAIAPHPAMQMETWQVQGRAFQIKTLGKGIYQGSFQDLCGRAYGPADYLAIADRADTLLLTGIPLLTHEKRNEAKRFVTLIDALYEHKVKLICTAETLPEKIYPEGDGAFEFRRTVSRLAEMQSAQYLLAAAEHDGK